MMRRQIIKQPNGKYAVFSTEINSFVLIDATAEQIFKEWMKGESEENRAKVFYTVERIVSTLDHGGQPLLLVKLGRCN